MHLCLFEDDRLDDLYPLIHTRGVYQLRLGARTLIDRTWDTLGRPPLVLHTRNELTDHIAHRAQTPVNRLAGDGPVLFVNGRLVHAPAAFFDQLKAISASGDEARLFVQGEEVIAAWMPAGGAALLEQDRLSMTAFSGVAEEEVSGAVLIRHLWDLLDHLPGALGEDLDVLSRRTASADRSTSRIHSKALLVQSADIYMAESVRVHPGAILNAEDGPIYLAEGAAVMEAAIVKGPVYIGPGSVVKAQTNIAESAVGPVCKVAGEIHSAIFQSYSNKAHNGFAGNSYIGSWCNLGADTNTSNLRNDYGTVPLYNEKLGLYESSGRQFLGLIMADHSKCSINTMFNTGTIVGVFCNLYGSGFHARYIPSFSWGSPEEGYQPYRIDKALQVAERVMSRRKIALSDSERRLLELIFEKEQKRIPA